MCGIAGYNVSSDWVDQYLTDDRFETVIREAWLHNLHRGNDAAGFFHVDMDDNTGLFKQALPADKLLEELAADERRFVPAKVFGAHTRAATTGSPAVNANNHPVFMDGVYVTHNGMISNHVAAKNSYKGRGYIPEVDSAAINIALLESDWDDPHDLADKLDRLTGGFAFHAVHRDRPGLSILCRGPSNPLHIAWHPNGGFVYGSEEESVTSIIENGFGLDPQGEGWMWRFLDTGSVIIVENGLPKAWAGFPIRSTALGRADATVSRYGPVGGDGKWERIYSTDFSSDFAVKQQGGWSVLNVPAERYELVYQKGLGFADSAFAEKFTFPNSETSWLSLLAEADSAYKVGEYVHVFYGDVEVVLNKGNRTLREVFNHAVEGDRFVVYPKMKTVNADDEGLPFGTWFQANSSPSNPVELKGYDYLSYSNYSAKGGRRFHNALPFRGTPEKATSCSTVTVEEETIIDGDSLSVLGPKQINPHVMLGWSNINEHVIRVGSMPFFGDIICREHEVKASQHENIEACEAMSYGAAYVLSCVGGLFQTAVLTSGEARVVSSNHGEEDDTVPECGDHSFVFTDWVKVSRSGEAFWEIPVESICVNCDTILYVDKMPDWFSNLNGLDNVGRLVPMDQLLWLEVGIV